MSSVSVSSKGQMVIPKEVRQRLGIKSGSRLEISEVGGELRLKLTKRPGKNASIEAGLGLAGYKGPPVSIEEMDRAIRESAGEDDDRIRKGWNRTAAKWSRPAPKSAHRKP